MLQLRIFFRYWVCIPSQFKRIPSQFKRSSFRGASRDWFQAEPNASKRFQVYAQTSTWDQSTKTGVNKSFAQIPFQHFFLLEVFYLKNVEKKEVLEGNLRKRLVDSSFGRLISGWGLCVDLEAFWGIWFSLKSISWGSSKWRSFELTWNAFELTWDADPVPEEYSQLKHPALPSELTSPPTPKQTKPNQTKLNQTTPTKPTSHRFVQFRANLCRFAQTRADFPISCTDMHVRGVWKWIKKIYRQEM
jgi:hypothetical protein